MIIIGAGVAGMSAALSAAPHPVTLLDVGGAASQLSQGGLAAAVGGDDSVAAHIADTLAAGAGLCAPEAVARIVSQGPALVERLLALGVRFDRAHGALALGLEAAHSARRILHAQGDATGAELMRALTQKVAATPSVTRLTARAVRLLADESGISGVMLADGTVLPADRVLLATGGLGGLFARTTTPEGAIGAGVMLAQDLGAALADLEFIQFHPTALDVTGRVTLPLVSEAVRGEGARLVDETGVYFMNGADLSPRDQVARAVFARQQRGQRVYLDATHMGAGFATRFPAIAKACREAGIDPARQPIPVTPAAHYHMGGVRVDAGNETSVPGLFAAGEVARTGLHGANRLASNSLLEAAVCGHEAGLAMAGRAPRPVRPRAKPSLPAPDIAPIRPLMSAHLGVVRTTTGLETALDAFAAMPQNPAARLCAAIARAALARDISVGAHALAPTLHDMKAA
ncbi:L-aspartate oxidase [Acidocella sp.]|uniref:L-aspartate oxidase n=1 Tax=Acidocella sp. TaxID=50710 RepID=UPI002633F322|nr:FAD-binding protein [Acidocella sp.]